LSAYFKAEAFNTTGLNVSTNHVTIPAHISAKNGYESQHWLPDALQRAVRKPLLVEAFYENSIASLERTRTHSCCHYRAESESACEHAVAKSALAIAAQYPGARHFHGQRRDYFERCWAIDYADPYTTKHLDPLRKLLTLMN